MKKSLKKNRSNLGFNEVFEAVISGQSVVTIFENGTFSFYGEPLCSKSQENKIMCLIEGANQLIDESQVVISFSKL